MQPEHGERIAELVESALEHDRAERTRYLDEACRNDDALRKEVESLLHYEEQSQGLETPAYEQVAEAVLEAAGKLVPGELLSNYKIVSLVGAGGMGEVYLAEDAALGRKVALKLVKAGFDDATFLRHFRNEERILAGLTHPNIARLYGGDVTPDGLPYFVMEYVEGQRIDHYCREHSITLRQRLELFRQVCAAVAYAHQHLVIHRDLKPINIRVTLDGEPKLLDFGIAKLLDPESDLPNEQTITLQALMTPDYASPEQVRGEMMTTASDVYSLGVVLYELLTGERPYRFKTRRPDEIARAITEQEPRRPSTAVVNLKSEISNLKFLRGDLDNIVLKALRKEPERRYMSAAQFSDDIRRHLEGLPVSARKDTFGYRAGKFIKRNKVGVAGAALVFLTLAGGIVAASYEARRAQRRFNDVRHLANSLMFEIHDSMQDLPGSTPTRRLIVARALQYLDTLNAESGSDPSLQGELATAYEKVGDIQGNPYTANLGDTEGALASYRKATAIRERLTKRDSSAQEGIALAHSYRGVGDVFQLKGVIKSCLENYRHSLSILEQLAIRFPVDSTVQAELGHAYDTLGDGLGRTEAKAERLQSYRKALEIPRRLSRQNPRDVKLQRSVAVCSLKVADTEGVAKNEAVANINQAIAILEHLAAADPENARARRELGWAYYQSGKILSALEDHAGALPYREKALQLRAKVAADDPKNQQARFDLAAGHGELAESYENLHDSTKALEHAKQCAALFDELTASDPGNAVNERNLGLAHERLGGALTLAAKDGAQPLEMRRENLRQARQSYTRALGVFTALRDRGALMPSDTHQFEKVNRKIAETDKQIAELAR